MGIKAEYAFLGLDTVTSPSVRRLIVTPQTYYDITSITDIVLFIHR